ncbi:hypothetical protein WH357_01900 [Enterobacter ludwigii]
MTDNFHKDINELNLALRGLVSADIYNNIDDAVNYSSTSTEMLLKLKFYFSKIDLDIFDDNNLLHRVEIMQNKIDDLLK